MDRKNKVWLIVLIVLLIAALVGIVVVKNQLSAREADYLSVSSHLDAEQQNAAALQAELDSVKADLEARDAEYTQLQTDLAARDAEVSQFEESLAASAGEVEQLKADLEARAAELTALQAELEAARQAVSTDAPVADPQTTDAPIADPQTADAPENADLPAMLESAKAQADQMKAALDEGTLHAEDMLIDVTDLQTALADIQSALPEDAPEALADAVKAVENTARSIQVALAGEQCQPADKLADVEKMQAALETALNAIADASDPTPVAPVEIDTDDIDDLNGEIDAILHSDLSDEEKLAVIADLETRLSTALTDLNAAAAEIAQQGDAMAQMDAQLAAASASVAELERQLESGNAQIADLEGQIAALNAQSETDSAALADLEAQLAEVQAEVEALTGELESARAEYARRVSELEAYLLSRDLTDGEAHTATTADSVIAIASDGVTGAWNYANQIISGNTVVLSIVLDGAEIYRSEPITPGETLSEIALTTALAAGEYEATAVTAIYDADGAYLFANRIPVTLSVAE